MSTSDGAIDVWESEGGALAPPTSCVRCGRFRAAGHARINGEPYCHSDRLEGLTCYERASSPLRDSEFGEMFSALTREAKHVGTRFLQARDLGED